MRPEGAMLFYVVEDFGLDAEPVVGSGERTFCPQTAVLA